MNADREADSKRSIVSAIADGDTVDWSSVTLHESADKHEVEALQLLAALRGAPLPETPFTPLETGFDILAELGRGSFGQVFLARDRALNREVALKVLREDRVAGAEARERFLREARLLAQIEHPNVVRLYSIDENGSRLRLSLERLSGETLDRRVKRTGALPLAEVTRIGIALCDALAELHSRGIVHGDLKPANVMQTQDGRIVLLDFGIARGPRSEVDRREQVVPEGTPLYMAPEVFDGAVPDHRADLFALGAMLCWLATASHPFAGGDAFEIRALQSRGAPLDHLLAGRSARLQRVIAGCLSEDRELRPSDAASVAEELREIREAPLRRRRRFLALAAAAVIATVTGFAAARYFRAEPQVELLALRGAAEQRLKDGDRVVEGDRIVLELTTDRPGVLYVFNEDDQGLVSVLETGVEIGSAESEVGRPERFPTGQSGPREWVLAKGGKAEFFLAIISDSPITEVELLAEQAAIPPADPSLALSEPTRSVELKRAVAAPGVVVPSEVGTRIGSLVEQIQGRSGVVMRLWRLGRGDS